MLRAAAGATAGGPNRTKTLFSKQTDKFLATLSQGFGAAAAGNTPGPDANGENPNQVNYWELRCNELNDEIEELHRLINEGHGHDSVLASYIE